VPALGSGSITDQLFDEGSFSPGNDIIGADMVPPAGVAGPVTPAPIEGVRFWPLSKESWGFRGLGNGEVWLVGAVGDSGVCNPGGGADGGSRFVCPAGSAAESDPEVIGPMKTSTGLGVPEPTVFRVTDGVLGALASSAPEPTATDVCTWAVVPVGPARVGFPVKLPGVKVEMP
jgi:hypothetical protein